ncbi:MAG: hypothetical protein AB8G11_10070 [Saprospiraceae bacterium]
MQQIVGGYRGETIVTGGSDQIKKDGTLRPTTADGSGVRNDGFNDSTWEN